MKEKLRTTALCAILLCIAVAACSFGACAEDASEFEPFIRIDRDDADACNRELENLRIITGDLSTSWPGASGWRDRNLKKPHESFQYVGGHFSGFRMGPHFPIEHG